jgi:hypothetical protein
MKYDKRTGRLAVRGKRALHYATQRWVQSLRRGKHVRGWKKIAVALELGFGSTDPILWERPPVKLQLMCVMEPTAMGVFNHANLVIASEGPLPPDSVLSDIWAHSTYGTSYNVLTSAVRVEDEGRMASYLAKNLGNYLSKTLEEEEAEGEGEEGDTGAEGAVQKSVEIATRKRVSNYVSTSRDWLPYGHQWHWLKYFKEKAYFWRCDRGFYHTEATDARRAWFSWLKRQGMATV